MGEKRQIAGSVITSRKVYDETGGWDAEDRFYRMPVFVVTHRPHEVVVKGEIRSRSSPRASSTPSSRRSWPLGTSWCTSWAAPASSSRRWRPGWSTSCSCVAPVILNSGTRLFEHLGGPIQLERAEVIESRPPPAVRILK